MNLSDDKHANFRYDCSCGNTVKFKSKQPGDATEPLICERCRTATLITIPERNEKYLYTRRDDITKIRCHILEVFQSYRQAMTVRQVFYRLLNKGYPKSESFYGKIQRQILEMRLQGVLPFPFVVDNSRSVMRPDTYSGLEQALQETKIFYRRSLWDNTDVRVEVWLEKRALAGVFADITHQYDVELYPVGGFPSVTLVQEAAMQILNRDQHTHIYFFTDYDPSGVKLAEGIQKRMKEFGVTHKATFHYEALTRGQINEYDLPTRPTKNSKHSKNWNDDSVELDALDPEVLQSMVERCIKSHIDPGHLHRMEITEQAEKETLETIINNLGQA